MSTKLAKRRPRPLRRGAYVLPSLFTMGNVLLGFYAVVLAHRGEFERAPWMIILAGVLDGLDGRIARLTHTESEFGKELDSLADVLTFGAAPALIAYLWGLHEHGRVGWLIPLFFLLCTAIRLARFNVQVRAVDSRQFVGLPSPAAAGALMAFMFLDQQLTGVEAWATLRHPMLAVCLVVVGALMVSTFRYPSFKKIDLRRRWSYRAAAGTAVLLLLVLARPVIAFQALAAGFALAGPVSWLVGRVIRQFGGPERAATDDPPATAHP